MRVSISLIVLFSSTDVCTDGEAISNVAAFCAFGEGPNKGHGSWYEATSRPEGADTWSLTDNVTVGDKQVVFGVFRVAALREK